MGRFCVDIHDLILIVTCVQSILLAALLFVIPTKRVQPRKILGFFFLVIAVWICATLSIWNEDLQQTGLNHTVVPTVALVFCLLVQGPALYFYLRSLTEDIRFKQWTCALHLLPALGVSLSLIVVGAVGVDWPPQAILSEPKRTVVNIAWAMVRCSPLIYMFACFWVEYKLRKRMQEIYSSISSAELILSDFVLIGFFIYWLWTFSSYLMGDYISLYANDLLGKTNDFIITLLVNGLFVFGLLNTRKLLNLADDDVVKSSEFVVDREKIDIIQTLITTKKPYLESNINLERFSALAGLKARDTSAHINKHYKSNFFDFINGLRLEEAKRMLISAEHINESITDIMYQSGFNSQSAFQRFFKKNMGMTPTEYRRQHLVQHGGQNH